MYIDELDEEDNVNVRMAENAKYRNSNFVKPEMEWLADGTVMLTMCIPTNRRTAEAVAVEIAKKFGCGGGSNLQKLCRRPKALASSLRAR